MSTSFYKNCLSEDLQAQVTRQLSKLIPEQLSLNEEVAIDKARCADLVREWSKARSLVTELESNLGDDPDPSMLALTDATRSRMYALGDRVADALKGHKDVVVAAANTEVKTREVLTERTLMLFIQAALDLAHNYFNNGSADSQKIMDDFELDLRERVVIQEADNEALGIELEIAQMFDSVPMQPEALITE